MDRRKPSCSNGFIHYPCITLLGPVMSRLFSFAMKEYNSETNPFYLTPRWQRKRAAILRRDKYLCQECRRYGRMREARTVHHIKHLEDAPELAYEDSNLISLCYACHNKMHPEKGANGTKRYSRVSAYGAGERKRSKSAF